MALGLTVLHDLSTWMVSVGQGRQPDLDKKRTKIGKGRCPYRNLYCVGGFEYKERFELHDFSNRHQVYHSLE